MKDELFRRQAENGWTGDTFSGPDKSALNVLHQAAVKGWPMAEQHMADAVEIALKVSKNHQASPRDRAKAAEILARVGEVRANLLIKAAQNEALAAHAGAGVVQVVQPLEAGLLNLLDRLEEQAGDQGGLEGPGEP